MTELLVVVVFIVKAVAAWLVVGALKGAIQAHFERRIEAAAALLAPATSDAQRDAWMKELKDFADRPVAAWRFVRGVEAASVRVSAEYETRGQSETPHRLAQLGTPRRSLGVLVVIAASVLALAEAQLWLSALVAVGGCVCLLRGGLRYITSGGDSAVVAHARNITVLSTISFFSGTLIFAWSPG